MENILFFDDEFKNNLRKKAKESVRRRAHHNIHDNYADPVQRLAIGLCYGTYIPPHKHIHEKQWEFFHLIEGVVKLIIFSE
ncbi:TPA: WbuC family cupin fold metalloprotein, partial [Yersinia enterocolitica]|nr:WbuC family cupin fold metalloprotein [Yersinia enterocolitica]